MSTLFSYITPTHRVISWPGSKYRQLDQILKFSPGTYRKLCEPFLGTASFSINKFDEIEELYWSEACDPLFYWWDFATAISTLDQLIQGMSYFRNYYTGSQECFKEMRSFWNTLTSEGEHTIESCALLWVLIYASTNNLARFNKKKGYTQSWGKGRRIPNPEIIFTEEYKKKLCKMGNSLVSFESDFRNCLDEFLLDEPDERDICFLDPPYILFSDVYDMNWKLEDTKAVFEYIKELDSRNVKWLLTEYIKKGDDYHPFVDTMYKDYTILEIDRKCNACPNGRTKEVIEVLMMSKRF